MNKLFSISIVFALFSCMSNSWAQENDGLNPAVKEGIKAVGGFFTGLLVHEAGHLVALKSKGIDYDFEFPTGFRYEGRDTGVQTSGFVAQAISTELILLKKERNNYLYGWLAWNTLNEIWYPLNTILTSRKDGDLGSDSMSTSTRNRVSALLLTHASMTIYRLSGDADFAKNIQLFVNDPDEGSGVAYSVYF